MSPDGRGAHAARDRRREDLPARPSDLRGRARGRRAARRRRGGRERARPALRERGRGPAPLPQGHGPHARASRARSRAPATTRSWSTPTARRTRSRAASPRRSRSWPTPRRRRAPRCRTSSCSAASATAGSARVSDLADALRRTAERVAEYRRTVGERPVAPPVDAGELGAALGGPLPDEGTDPGAVIDELVAARRAGARRHGGAALLRVRRRRLARRGDARPTCSRPAGTRWRSTRVSSPAAAAVEEVAGGWVKELLGLPADASVGFVTGAQGANTVGARGRAAPGAGGRRLGRRGATGCTGAPPVRVLAGEERHATIDRSLRLLGLGADALEPVAVGRATARWTPSALAAALARDGGRPTIVCAQAGNVNTGACDDLRRDRRSRDGARRVGARRRGVRAVGGGEPGDAPPRRRRRARRLLGRRRAQVAERPLRLRLRRSARDRDAHAAAMAYTAAYLAGTGGGRASATRARVVAPGARLRGAGRRCASWAASGVAELVDRCCALARRFAERLAEIDGVEIGNDVVLNQVLVGLRRRRDAPTRVIDARAARRHLLDGRHHLAGPPLDAHLGVELVDDGGGRRPLRRDHRPPPRRAFLAGAPVGRPAADAPRGAE